MSNTKVSIIIINYRNYKETLKCINSLLNQTFKDFEILLIDNSVNINEFLSLKTFIIQHLSKLKIRLFKTNKNIGFTGGSNLGIKYSKGTLICILNPDTIPLNDFLEKSVNFLDKNENCGFISPKIIVVPIDFRLNDKNIILYKKKLDNTIVENYFVEGTAVLFEKKLIKLIGYFDELYFMYKEDVEMGVRANSFGYKNYYLNTTLIFHKIRIGKKKVGKLYKYYLMKRNTILNSWKYFNLRLLYTNYIKHIFPSTLLEVLFFLKKKKLFSLKDRVFAIGTQIRAIIMGTLIAISKKMSRKWNIIENNEYNFILKLIEDKKIVW